MTNTRITFDEVAHAYSGAASKCCCGCSGKHYYAAPTGDYRGGGTANDHVQIIRIMGKVNAALIAQTDADCAARPEIDLNREYSPYIAATYGNRIYIVYFKEAK